MQNMSDTTKFINHYLNVNWIDHISDTSPDTSPAIQTTKTTEKYEVLHEILYTNIMFQRSKLNASFNISISSTCGAELTGGSAEEAAFSSLSKTIWFRVWVATVPFLPPFKLWPCPWPKFPWFDHFWG